MITADELVRMLGIHGAERDIQVIQTAFRMRLVDGWKISPGARVLEVGCGQGDMTAVLALAVGPDGHVTAVDSADPGYGAPLTLGEATQRLQKSELGSRMSFHFGRDLSEPSQAFPANAFDYVVFTHCSWYFSSLEHFTRILSVVRPWARQLCYSEWNLEPQDFGQVAHLLSALIQGQIEVFKQGSSANIRTPFSRDMAKRLLCATGWKVESEFLLDAAEMHDANWEIAACLQSAAAEMATLEMPSRLRDLLTSQLDVLRAISVAGPVRPLVSHSILANRDSDAGA